MTCMCDMTSGATSGLRLWHQRLWHQSCHSCGLSQIQLQQMHCVLKNSLELQSLHISSCSACTHTHTCVAENNWLHCRFHVIGWPHANNRTTLTSFTAYIHTFIGQRFHYSATSSIPCILACSSHCFAIAVCWSWPKTKMALHTKRDCWRGS